MSRLEIHGEHGFAFEDRYDTPGGKVPLIKVQGVSVWMKALPPEALGFNCGKVFQQNTSIRSTIAEL
jgi:hypothetical protein